MGDYPAAMPLHINPSLADRRGVLGSLPDHRVVNGSELLNKSFTIALASLYEQQESTSVTVNTASESAAEYGSDHYAVALLPVACTVWIQRARKVCLTSPREKREQGK